MASTINTRRCACGAVPGERHRDWCLYPIVVTENRRELWAVERQGAGTREFDARLEAANKRALEQWVREGRTL